MRRKRTSGGGRARRTETVLQPTASPRTRLVQSWRGALLLAWVAVIYLPSLFNGFVYDDDSVIREAAGLFDHPGVRDFFSTDYFYRSHESTYRPIVTLTYLIDWKIAGANAWIFHVQNLAWHLVAVGCLLLLLKRLDQAPIVRYGAAALYGAHPALTEAVDSLAFREDVLVTAFGLLGLLVTTGRWPRTRGVRLVTSSLCFGAAMLSKETGVVLVCLVPLTFWVMGRVRASSIAWTVRTHRSEYLALAAITCAYAIVRFGWLPPAGNYGSRIGDSLAASLATGVVVAGYYVRLLVYPYALCADYRGVVAFVTSATDWRFWVSAATIVGLSAAAWSERAKNPIALWGWIWFVVCLAPVSNIVPIPTFMAERFLHLPFVGVVVFVVSAFASSVGATGVSGVVNAPNRPSWRSRGLAVVIALVFVTFSALTWMRHQAWSSNETLWRTTLKDHPAAFGAMHGYGSVLVETQRYAEAIPYLQRALQGDTVDNDRRAAVLLDLGVALWQTGRSDDALTTFESALRAAPSSKAHSNLGVMLLQLGRLDEAAGHWREALRLQPGMVEAEAGLDAVRARQGR